VSAAPDYMVRKKIRQKVARQLITSIVVLWTNLQHLQFFVAENFFDKTDRRTDGRISYGIGLT